MLLKNIDVLIDTQNSLPTDSILFKPKETLFGSADNEYK